ncbi:MAG: alanine--glyoxylate aminotransferase family protein [Candidatus Bathyarchaeota archaeon]
MLLMTPGPTNVSSRVMKAMSRSVVNHRGPEFHAIYESIEENLKYVFQTENEVFILSSSGTGGVECAVSNVVSKGDKVLVPVNGDFSYRLEETVKAFGGQPVEIPVKWGDTVDLERIREIVDNEKDIKAIAVVYNETSTGAVTRCLEGIGKLARARGILFIVDAVSAVAGDELPVDDWNIDLCVTCSQKSIAAPPGLAMVSLSGKVWESVEKTTASRNNYYFDLKKFRDFHQRKETPFTPAVSLFYALDEALNMVKDEGLENRIARHKVCAKAFYDAAEAMCLELLANERIRSNTVIAIKNPSEISDKAIQDTMLNDHGITIAGGMGPLRGSTFRIGSMGIVSRREVVATVDALENTLRSLGMKLEKGLAVRAAEKAFK